MLQITAAGLHSRLVRGQIVPVFPPPEERRHGKPLYFSRQAIRSLPRQRRVTPAIDAPPQWLERDCIYLAGIIDGEGCITIAVSHDTNKVMRLQIVNTHEGLIQWLETTFGPGIITRKPVPPGHKGAYQWTICSVGAYHILQAVLPHLIVKKQQALLAIQYQEPISANNRKKRLLPEEKERRCRLHAAMKRLNKKGRQP